MLTGNGRSCRDPRSPSNRSGARIIPRDGEICKERHLVESFIGKTNHLRRTARPYEKTTVPFLAMLSLCASMVWSN